MASRLNPPNKRTPIHQSWLNMFMAPLATLNDSFFNTYFPDVQKRAKQTGQKILLEQTLNNLFNPGNARKITIDNSGDDLGTSFFYNSNEGYPAQYFYNENEGETPFYFYNQSEYFGLNDFVVFVPIEVINNFTVDQVRSEINKFRPVGTKFNLKLYT